LNGERSIGKREREREREREGYEGTDHEPEPGHNTSLHEGDRRDFTFARREKERERERERIKDKRDEERERIIYSYEVREIPTGSPLCLDLNQTRAAGEIKGTR
jgi:hypothetical protein